MDLPDGERIPRVFKPCSLASLKQFKVQPCFPGFVPTMASLASGTAYYRNWPTPGGPCSVLEDGQEPVAGLSKLKGAWEAFKVPRKSTEIGYPLLAWYPCGAFPGARTDSRSPPRTGSESGHAKGTEKEPSDQSQGSWGFAGGPALRDVDIGRKRPFRPF